MLQKKSAKMSGNTSSSIRDDRKMTNIEGTLMVERVKRSQFHISRIIKDNCKRLFNN